MKNKLKNPHQDTKGTKVNINPDLISIYHHKHPIFCFKYIHKEFDLEKCTADEKVAFIEQVCRLSQLSWQDIEYTQRHGLGTEKISVSSLGAKCPSIVTDEVTHLLALRFIGKMPFLGYRDRFLLHVLFIDRTHSLY